MDCTDIVIGTAIGNEARVGDYYTRDRSTPRHDEFYGGTQSLTAVLGREVDGVTTIMFRRKINGTKDSNAYKNIKEWCTIFNS